MQLFILRKLENLYEDEKIVKIGLMSSSIGFLIISLLYYQPTILLLLFGLTLLGFGQGSFNPVIRAMLTKHVDSHGKYLGLLSSYISLTMIIGPFIAGNLFEFVNPAMPFLAAFLMMMTSFFVFKKF
jgi:MFS family permease